MRAKLIPLLTAFAVFTMMVNAAPPRYVPSNDLLDAMPVVESSYRTNVVHKVTGATGLYQIRAIALKDINRKFGTSYVLADFISEPRLGAWAVWAYGSIYGASTDEEFARIWYGGPLGSMRKSTEGYWSKIKRVVDERRKKSE